MKKILFKKIVLLITTVLCLIIIAELTLRLIDYEPKNELLEVNYFLFDNPLIISKDPILAYEFKPNYSGEEYKMNSLGFQDYEYTYKKPEDTFRVLVIGDSVTRGVGVYGYINKSYPKKLEVFLNQKNNNKKIEVLNAGVDGYNTVQESRYFITKGIKLQPDLLIVSYVLENDYSNYKAIVIANDNLKRVEYYDNNIKYFRNPKINEILIKNSYFFRFFNNEIIRIFKIQNNVSKLLLGNEEFIKSIKEIKKVSEKNDVKVLFVLFPSLDSRDHLDEREMIKDILDSINIKYLDLLPVFRQYNNFDLIAYPNDITHPNEFGYELAAKEIYRYLIENNMVLV